MSNILKFKFLSRYFVSTVIEFQLYEGLCKTARLFDSSETMKPLFKCDFSNNKAVGTRLRYNDSP